uniref:Hemimethylated DNA-binding domain-containing protein n=1 Tax=Ciona savignyi TaxID=51511 RepID=H2Y440_CIOSA
MPDLQLTRLQALQLLLIFAAVPMQFLLSEYVGTSKGAARRQTIHNLIESIKSFSRNYFSISGWRTWIHTTMKSIVSTPFSIKIGKSKIKTPEPYMKLKSHPECIAEEVFLYRNSYGLFATSSKPRRPRDAGVKFRVGQVIRHKLHGYRGVIVGWDKTCKAPETWIRQNHHKSAWRLQPNYAVLVDERDRQPTQTTYVVQENIEIVKNVKIKHKSVDDFFDHYDGAQYIMRPALQEVYPYD